MALPYVVAAAVYWNLSTPDVLVAPYLLAGDLERASTTLLLE
jgi:hypothetical protein